MVVERQKLMADQIKLRRQQKREKNRLAQGMRETEQSSPEPGEQLLIDIGEMWILLVRRVF